jgi:hypothetical protein
MGGGALAALVASCAMSRPAEAQITNVLNKARNAEPDGVSYVLTGRLDWRSGNVNRVDVAGDTTFIGQSAPHLVLVSANGQFAVQDEERIISRHLEHARYRLTVYGPFELEAFVQHDFNQFRRRAVRVVFGTGPRVVIPIPGPLDQAFGLAYMPEYEVLSEGDYADSGVMRWHHRLSAYSSTSVDITNRIQLAGTIFVQPALNRITNARMFGELGFNFGIWGPLSITASWVIQLDTEPPESVRPTDSVRLFGLTLKL